ncbi:MAG: hypothetical protein ACYDC1_04225 [Limisphaerales bacterium]
MNELKKESDTAVHCLMAAEGYVKRTRAWYRDTAESVVVLDLDWYAGVACPYLGVSFKQLSTERFPKFNKCSWYGKMICRDSEGREFIAILNLQRMSMGLARSQPRSFMGHSLLSAECGSIGQMVEYIRVFGVPFLRRIETLDGFKSAHAEGQFRHFPMYTRGLWQLMTPQP